MSLLEKLVRSKLFVVTALALPGLWPIWPLAVRADATALADPGKYLLHHLGLTAAVLLAVVLSFTPLRVLFPRAGLTAALNRHRRLVGVTAFAYAALHVAMHFIYEGGFGTFATDWRKPFIAVGIAAFGILLLLAITSPGAVVRRLGGRRWKALHRIVYLAAVLVIYHQVSARKVFPMEVIWVFGPLLALEVGRVAKQVRRARQPAKPGIQPGRQGPG